VDNTNRQVDEAGALTANRDVGRTEEAHFFSVGFTAVADGMVEFTVSLGDGTATITPPEFALVGRATPVPSDQVDFTALRLRLSRRPRPPFPAMFTRIQTTAATSIRRKPVWAESPLR
jgi:hypothetical protein